MDGVDTQAEIQALTAEAEAEIALQCADRAQGLANTWMEKLEGCADAPLWASKKQEIRNGLIEVMTHNCDSEQPFGASTLPAGESTSPSGYISFADVLEKKLGLGAIDILCNADLINFPGADGHEYASYTSHKPIDECACEAILETEQQFTTDLSAGNLPTGVTTSEQLFEYTYETEIEGYGAKVCLCNKAAAGTSGTDEWSSGYDWENNADMTVLTNSAEYIVADIACQNCEGCTKIRGSFNNYQNNWLNGAPESDLTGEQRGNLYNMTANYLNNLYSLDLTYTDYEEFVEDCTVLSTGTPVCDTLTAQGTAFVNTFPTSITIGVVSAVPQTCNWSISFIEPDPNTNASAGYDLNNIIPDLGNIRPAEDDPTNVNQFWADVQLIVNNELVDATILVTSSCYTLWECITSADNMELCNRTFYLEIEDDCEQDLIDAATHSAENQYGDYIEEVIDDIENNYMEQCTPADNAETFTMQYPDNEHHYTLYYYNQSGNLTRTVPPAGVELVPSGNWAAVNADRENGTTNISTEHRMETRYKYNSLNQLTHQTMPDHDKMPGKEWSTRFFYDKLGRIVASQNSKQKAYTPDRYSYTKYDELGRIVEAGELKSNDEPTDATFEAENYPNNWSLDRVQVVKTFYDRPINDNINNQFGNAGQENLRNRVASIIYQEELAKYASSYQSASHFSYDIHGNVKKLVQENTELAHLKQQFKTMTYDYDLISGNVHQVNYQEGKADQFFHSYEYDGDNRITTVMTSPDGVIWDEDARYEYYQHGPLARTEIGDLRVQGCDFAYTIQGWIKGVNSNTLTASRDIGKDSHVFANNPNADVAPDVYGYGLGYYDSDYQAIGTAGGANNFTELNTGDLGTASHNLFNGNISKMVTAINLPSVDDSSLSCIDDFGLVIKECRPDDTFTFSIAPSGLGVPGYNISGDADAYGVTGIYNSLPFPTNAGVINITVTDFNNPSCSRTLFITPPNCVNNTPGSGSDGPAIAQGNAYHYDQLNRIISSTTFNIGGTNPANNLYNTSYSYDANGNILSLLRNGDSNNGQAQVMDDMTYHYEKDANGNIIRNRLLHVNDPIPATNYDDDIDDQGDIDITNENEHNYQYDEIGNLTSDNAEDIKEIVWRVDGKVERVIRKAGSDQPDLLFKYDPSGNRITKAAFHKNPAAGEPDVTYTHYVRDASGNTMAVYKRQQTLNNNGTLTDHLTLNEQHLYGSSRLGLRSVDNTLNNSTFENLGLNLGEYQLGDVTNSILGRWKSYRTHRPLGAKTYELSNHLGNVLATVSDRKLWANNGNSRIADVKSASDYYPFGMAIADRTMQGEGYRYGFNGKESDPSGEWGTQSIQDYGFRIYNPGLGRFLSVDPLSTSFPFYTPYQFSANTPIQAVDLDGAEDVYYLVTFDDNGKSKLEVSHVQNGAIGNLMGENMYVSYGGITYYQSSVPNSRVMKYTMHGIIGAPTKQELLGKYEGKTQEELDAMFSSRETRSEMVQSSREESDAEMAGLFQSGVGGKSHMVKAPLKPKTPKTTISKPKVEVAKKPATTPTKVYTTEVSVGTTVSKAKMLGKNHLESTTKSTMRSHADAQKVLDNYHSGKLEILGANKQNGQILVRDKSVTGDWRTNSGQTTKESNIFVIKGESSVTVFPKNPDTN